MTKTQFYNLNNWSIDDRVLHTDFNADNAAIDAALHAVDEKAASAVSTANTVSGSIDSKISQTRAYAQSLVPIVKLVDHVMSAESKTLDVNLSGIAWSQYAMLIVCVELKLTYWGGNYVPVTFNHDNGNNYIRSGQSAQVPTLAEMHGSANETAALIMRIPYTSGNTFAEISSFNPGSQTGSYFLDTQARWCSDVKPTSLNFQYQNNFAVGTRVIVYGLKR